MKRHGFDPPLHPLQVLSWMTMAAILIGFYLLDLPALDLELRVTACILYTALFVFVVLLGLICTLKDNCDPTVKAEREATQLNVAFDSLPYTKQCPVCNTHVLEKTKHCMDCDRCVRGFDHHCKWLNNCIGEDNYRQFCLLIILLELLLIISIAFGVFTLVRVHNEDCAREKIQSLFSTDDITGYYVASIGVTVVAFLVAAFNGNLIAFHIYLRVKNLTTYQFITARRERKAKVVDFSNRSYKIENVGGNSTDKHLTDEASLRFPNLITPSADLRQRSSLEQGL